MLLWNFFSLGASSVAFQVFFIFWTRDLLEKFTRIALVALTTLGVFFFESSTFLKPSQFLLRFALSLLQSLRALDFFFWDRAKESPLMVVNMFFRLSSNSISLALRHWLNFGEKNIDRISCMLCLNFVLPLRFID